MALKKYSKTWLSSTQVKSKTKIKSCDLMHYRQAGKLKFIKQGNAFLYDKESVDDLLNSSS